jgi:hypothetical protein
MRLAVLAAIIATGCGESAPVGYPPFPEETENEIRACIDDDCSYRTVALALASAPDGATVRILPGVYRDGGILRADGVRIEAEGAYLFDAAWEEKASLVIKGDDTVIVGLRCSHIRVPDANGACVRAEGRDLTLRGVHFHDSQTGILSGRTKGRIVIEDSTFERLGNRGGEAGNAHGIYVGSADELILRRSRVLESVGEGHEVKSRAARTIIEDNVIASLSGVDSRQIDLPNGGDIVIRGNVLEKGPNSSNHQVVGIGMERGRGHGRDHARNRAVIEGNTVLIDRRGANEFVSVRNVPEAEMRDNLVVDDRDAAGIDAFPFIPSRPLN